MSEAITRGETGPSAASVQTRRMSRRAWLGGTAAVFGLTASVAKAANDTNAGDFTRLSEFLTGKTLNPGLGARYLAALSKRDPQFAAKAGALRSFIESSNASGMDALMAAGFPSEPLKQTATEIVLAWYLGIVGEGADAELISYADALMYRPARGALIVPTYGGGPDSWGEKPRVTL